MDIEKLKLPEELFGDGLWVPLADFGAGVAVRVRPMWNSAFRRRYDQMVLDLPADRRVGALDPDDEERILGVCLAETVLTGWRGLTSGGEPLDYSQEAAARYCADRTYLRFRRLVVAAASAVEDRGKASIEAEAGN